MPNDTTLQSVFDYAKQGPLSGGEFPKLPAVFVTFVEHFPNSHPPGSSKGSADLVTYANGQMTLSQSKKMLSGEFKLWRNAFDPGSPGFFGPPTPPDAFDDADTPLTVAITVSDSGQVTHQRKLKGTPIGGIPPSPMNAAYQDGLFVEKSTSGARSLSFTLGTTTSSG